MSARSPLSGVKRKSDFGAVRSAYDRYCCKSPKRCSAHFSAEKGNKRQSSVDRASNPILESPMSSACCDVVPHIIIQLSHVRLGEFESHAAKRLLQQYRPKADV